MDCIITITAIKDIVLAVSAATMAIVAVVGLSRWRKELNGKANFEVARALARATYKLRDELAICRSPFIRGQEFPASYSSSLIHTVQEEGDAYAHMYKERWNFVREAMQEFDAQSLEAESLWGKAIRSKTDDLRSCATELYVAIEEVVEDKISGGKNFATDSKFSKDMRQTVHASGNDSKNPLSNNIIAAVQNIEQQLQSHLARS